MLRSIPQDRLAVLATNLGSGLTDNEAEHRRAIYGSNDIAEKPPATWRKLARDTAADPMIWFLILTSGLFGAIGQTTDMVVLLAGVTPSSAWTSISITAPRHSSRA